MAVMKDKQKLHSIHVSRVSGERNQKSAMKLGFIIQEISFSEFMPYL
jgi:hypothetical protein